MQVVDPGVHKNDGQYQHPHSFLQQPVFKELHDPKSDLVGILQSVVPWDSYLQNLLPTGVKGIVVVLKNTCGQEYTYTLDGDSVSIHKLESGFHFIKLSHTFLCILH